MSGFTRMCGEEGGSPLHLGYPISDAIGGLFGAVGVLSALFRLKEDPASRGQEIDCSMTEAMLRTLDFLAISMISSTWCEPPAATAVSMRRRATSMRPPTANGRRLQLRRKASSCDCVPRSDWGIAR